MTSTRGWPRRDRLGDHTTWRPEWTEHRTLLWWYLTFDHLPAVAEHASRAAAALHPLHHIDVPPAEWLHLTLCEVGFRGEADVARVLAGVRGVREAVQHTGPVEMTLGPVNSLEDAVVLEAGPIETLRALRVSVRRAMAAAGVVAAQHEEHDFWPHVTIGYLNAPDDHHGLMDLVGATAGATTTLAADRLELVEVTRADRHYRWRTWASVQLGRSLVPDH